MATFDPGAVRFRLSVTDEAMAATLRPYVEKYCTKKQLGNLEPGKRLSLDVPSPAAAAELYPLNFAYGTPDRLTQLEALILASGATPPKLDIQSDTSIAWLFLGVFETLLLRADIHTVGDLTGMTEAELSDIPNIGAKTVALVKERLQEHGLSLKGE